MRYIFIFYKKAEGSVTIFMTFLFLLFFSLTGIALENARVISSRGYMQVAADSAAMTLFGDYNSELYQEYGLFGYGGYDGIGQESIQEKFLQILEENIRTAPRHAVKNYVNLYRLHSPDCQIDFYQSIEEPDVFYREIENYLKSIAVKDTADAVRNKFRGNRRSEVLQDKLAMAEDYEKGKYDKPEREDDGQKKGDKPQTDVQETEYRKEEKEKEDTAGGNPLESFSDIIRDGVLQLVCDEKTLSDGKVERREEGFDEQESAVEQKSAAEFLQEFIRENPEAAEIGQSIPSGKKKLLLWQYAQKVFSYYGEKTKKTTKYGLEYLIAGKEEEKSNLAAVVNRLLAIRMLTNFAYVASDGILQEKSLATATALAGFTGMPPVVTAVQYTILLILAFEEACVDITALLDGKQIPMVKNATNFKLAYEEICMASKSLFRKKAAQYQCQGKSVGVSMVSYLQYLQIFLLLEKRETLQERMCDLIQYDLRERYNQSFTIVECIGTVHYRVSYQIPLIFGKLPFVQKNTFREAVRNVEVHYGYESE